MSTASSLNLVGFDGTDTCQGFFNPGAQFFDGGEVDGALLLQFGDAVEGIAEGGAGVLLPGLEQGPRNQQVGCRRRVVDRS